MMYITISKVMRMTYSNVYLNQKQELKKIKHNNNNHQQEYGNKHLFKDLLLCIYCIEFRTLS